MFRCPSIGIPDAAFQASLTGNGDSLSVVYDQLSILLPVTPEPAVVPLFCNEFDALDIIETPGTAAYRGQLPVMTPKLPSRQIALWELRGHAVRQAISLEMTEQT